ncbi:aldehyde dehydrogenase [Xanthobacter agilis]|uniref:aldehyde dehydrogenase n=1 Tax=Xanthobacter agilis TaxID=47492 RepID=UPI003726358E
MTEHVCMVVEEANRDDLSRKAGIFLYVDTRLWLTDGTVHRDDGPALLSPDGVVRWYLHGKDVTRDANTLFRQQGWPLSSGLDTAEKQHMFKAHFSL